MTHHSHQEVTAVLDMGTSKVVCLIGQHNEAGQLNVTGIGHQLSKGIRAGAVTDVGEAQTSIVGAVHAAEQMADVTIDKVIVNLSGSSVMSRNVTVELEVSGDAGVSDQDVMDAIHEGCRSVLDDGLSIVHCFPLHYRVDDSKGMKDPRGMMGDSLQVDLHIVLVKNSVIKNIANCLGRCHLDVADYVFAPHASALSALQEDEMELGVTLVDIGGGTTDIAVFVGGKNVFSDSLPIGGSHITSDVAKGLSTGLQDAERIKTVHGSAIASPKDADVLIDVPQLGEEEDEEDPTQLPRDMLVGIVRPRLEELFEMVRGRLETAGMDKVAGRRCVITGGGSQMLGMVEMSGRMLGKQVRLGKPHMVPGLADSVSGAPFSSVVGMFDYGLKLSWEDELFLRDQKRGGALGNVWKKVKNWIFQIVAADR